MIDLSLYYYLIVAMMNNKHYSKEETDGIKGSPAINSRGMTASLVPSRGKEQRAPELQYYLYSRSMTVLETASLVLAIRGW